MLSYEFLFDIALILMSTKLLGLLTKRIQLPQVVGALLAGLLLGPACLNILHETDFILQLAELGVIVLMFTAGLETDIKELKKTGKASMIIAILGMIIPLIGGFALASLFNQGGISDAQAPIILQNIFIRTRISERYFIQFNLIYFSFFRFQTVSLGKNKDFRIVQTFP